MRPTGPVLLAALLWGACGPGPVTPAATPTPTSSPAALSPSPSPSPTAAAATVEELIGRVSIDRMRQHMLALAAFGSRDPRHPGHAEAQAYIRAELEALDLEVFEHRAVYQGIPLTSIFTRFGPPAGEGWILVLTHYDSIAKNTPGWRPALDPAPGANDNATGTGAVLEFARILSEADAALRRPVLLGFMDGEELTFRGSAAYLQSLDDPSAVAAVVNIDMVGGNPLADRLDLIWWTAGSAELRDRVRAVNARYAIGIDPLVDVPASSAAQYILDSAPFGVAGIPAITLAERYGPADATYPGFPWLHTVEDTPDKVVNESLWLKASRLTLATALELARE